MPAYFEVNFQYSKKADTVKSAVEDFYTALLQCGLSFQSGFMEAKNDSLADIIQWNQKKLDENFELDYTEHCSHDYKQVLFSFHDFSEARVFIQNVKNFDSVFFMLIIPEAEFVDYTDGHEGNNENAVPKTLFNLTDNTVIKYSIIKKPERMALIKDLIIHMWEIGGMNAIQTGWEGSDYPARFDQLVQGAQPNIEPICIVPQDIVRPEWDCGQTAIERGGVLLENDENWFPE